MAAFTDLNDYLTRLKRGDTHLQQANSQSIAAQATNFFSGWTSAGFLAGAGATPTTAAVPSRTIAGAIGQPNPSIGELFIPRVEMARATSGMMILCDRLSHQGGLSGTSTSAQTTNLPTAALTRYTNGQGVWAGAEIYSAVGTTGTTITCSYTNEQGTSGRTSIATAFGGTNHRTVGRFVMFPLAGTDFGVRAVASVTLAASTTTAGNFGVTLFKPLLVLPCGPFTSHGLLFDGLFNNGGQIPEILSDACLFWLYTPTSTVLGNMSATLQIVDR